MQIPPAPPAPPAPPPLDRRITITTEQGGQPVVVDAPMSARELQAIRNRRENLSDQLVSVQRRRDNVADALANADPAARAGLQDRLAVLDARIVQLETDIATTGRELTSAAAGRAAVGGFDGFAGSAPPAFAGGLVTGMALIAFVMWLRRMRRGGRGPESRAFVAAQAEQMTRLEQSIDAIALEVERISEGQRFTARLMAEGQERLQRAGSLRDG